MVTIGFGIVVEKIVSNGRTCSPASGASTACCRCRWAAPCSTQAVGLVPCCCWAWPCVMLRLLRGRFERVHGSEHRRGGNQAWASASTASKVLAFVINCRHLQASAGALIAQQNQYINSDFITFNLSIFILLMVLFGGHSVYGPLLGAVVLTLSTPSSRALAGRAALHLRRCCCSLYAMPTGWPASCARWRASGRLACCRPRRCPRSSRPGAPAAGPAPRRCSSKPRVHARPTAACGALNEVDLSIRAGHDALADPGQRRGQDHAAQHPPRASMPPDRGSIASRARRDRPYALPHRARGPGAPSRTSSCSRACRCWTTSSSACTRIHRLPPAACWSPRRPCRARAALTEERCRSWTGWASRTGAGSRRQPALRRAAPPGAGALATHPRRCCSTSPPPA